MPRTLYHTSIIERDVAYFKGDVRLLKLHTDMRLADDLWLGAQVDGWDYDDVRTMCSAYIQASYRYQRARWGKIRSRMSPSSLMR